MSQQIVETIALENGLTLEIVDQSRKVGADAWQVVMVARIQVPIEKISFPADAFTPHSLEEVIRTLGPEPAYVHREERNFIMDPDKEDLFGALRDRFCNTLMPYVAKPAFAEKFILRQMKDKKGSA